MGTWGAYPFGNDHAADFAGDLDDAPEEERLGLVRAALVAVVEGGASASAGEGDVAVAAAAVAARDLPGGAEFQHESYGPDERIPPIPQEIVALALRAVGRLLDEPSELAELWDGDPDWLASMERLRTVLAGRPSSA